MANPRILVLADDLTGALEMGGKFTSMGIPSLVTTRHDHLPSDPQSNARVVVIDTETRHLAPADAAHRIYALASAAHLKHRDAADPFLLYKKTDSTLRGNIGAELTAMIEAWSGAPLLYAPAYPRLGRMVRDGSLFVDGVPVAATSFANDLLNPVQQGHVPSLFAAHDKLTIHSKKAADLLNRPRWTISVCDGESEADMEAAAQALTGPEAFRLAAGPSGLAAHLARLLHPAHDHAALLPACRNVLVVNGSLHPVSRQQIVTATQHGMVGCDARALPTAGWTILDHALVDHELVDQEILNQNSPPARSAQHYARNLGKHLQQIVASAAFDALVVFGGDTAFALVEAIGHPPLHPIGEVMEGIPMCRIERKYLAAGREKDLLLVTKAGGFGPPDVLPLLQRSISEGGHS